MSETALAALVPVGAGLHMQWTYCTAGYKTRLESHIKTSRPGAVVLFDADGKSKADALRLARMYPDTVVIYRYYLQGDHQYRYISPMQFISEHLEFRDGPGNLFVQIDNEPNALAGAVWMLAVMKLARSYRIRCAVGGYGVGQPEPADLQTKEISDIIRYMAANPGWFVLNLHEYTEGSVFVDWAREARDVNTWPTSVPPGTAHHLMGRWKNWKRRAAELGVASPKIVIGEWGFDYIQAVEDHVYGHIGSILSSLPTWDQWTSLHPEVFAARMLQAIFKLLYDDPDIIGVVIFCISDHPTDWAEWNINYAPLFLAEIVKGFERMTSTPKPQTVANPHKPGKNRVTLAPGVVYVNKRDAPNGADKGDVHTGDILDVAAEPMQLGGSFYWFKIKTAEGDRWVAQTASIESLVPVSAVSIPAFIAQQRAILDEMEAAYNRGEL
jgi:hypothetical protein